MIDSAKVVAGGLSRYSLRALRWAACSFSARSSYAASRRATSCSPSLRPSTSPLAMTLPLAAARARSPGARRCWNFWRASCCTLPHSGSELQRMLVSAFVAAGRRSPTRTCLRAPHAHNHAAISVALAPAPQTSPDSVPPLPSVR